MTTDAGPRFPPFFVDQSIPRSKVVRVSSGSPTSAVCSNILWGLRRDPVVLMHCIGAGAVNQAVKGIIVAQQKIAVKGLVLTYRMGFTDLETGFEDTENDTSTAIVFRVTVSA